MVHHSIGIPDKSIAYRIQVAILSRISEPIPATTSGNTLPSKSMLPQIHVSNFERSPAPTELCPVFYSHLRRAEE